MSEKPPTMQTAAPKPVRGPQDAPALQAPPEITVLREVTDDPAYKNRQLAKNQRL